MNESDLPPPLPDDVSALVRGASGAVLAAPTGARARVLSGVESVVLGPPGGGPSGGGAPGVSAPPMPGAAGGVARAWPLAAAFLVGVGTGGLLAHGLTQPPVVYSERIIYVGRPVPPGAPPPAPDTTPAAVTASAVPQPSMPRPTTSSSSASTSGEARSQLDAERALLDVARSALTRQDGAAALDALGQHERRYPNGILVQEREAMAVRALVLLGRMDEARTRADRFRDRFPDSVLLQAVQASVARE